jgi:hypothetical protein
MRPSIALGLACALWTSFAPARAAVYAHRPFLTGGGFLALSQSERLSYATGVVEGILTAPYLGAPIGRASWLNGCLDGKDGAQLVEILSAYLRKHSEERRYEMPTVTLRAFTALCDSGSSVR